MIVCGSRDWTDHGVVETVLSGLLRMHGEFTLVEGCASGADYWAEQWYSEHMDEVVIEHHPAQWKQLGVSAGPRRNVEMAEAGADLCVAFASGGWDQAISKGTSHMLWSARNREIPVWVIRSVSTYVQRLPL